MNETAAQRERIVQHFREYQSRVSGWISHIWQSPPDDDYQKSEEYQAALDYYRSFEAQEGVDYTVAIAYARELHERYEKTEQSLDDKADAIIKYLGGGSAAVTLGALVSIKLDTWKSTAAGAAALACLLPSLVYAVRAVRAAVQVRRPRSAASLPPVDYAVRIAEFYKTKDRIEPNLWLILHPLSEAAHYRNLLKAKSVEDAHGYYRQSIGLLIVPIVGLTLVLVVLAGLAAR